MASQLNEAIAAGVCLALCFLALGAGCREPDRVPVPSPRVSTASDRLVNQSRNALEQGDLVTGLAMADSAAMLDPRNPDPHFMRGRLLLELNQYEQAEEAFKTVLQLEGGYPGAWINRGNAAFGRQQFRTALGHYRREVLDDARVWHAVGAALEKIGESDSARVAFETAVDRDEAYAPGHYSLSQFLERSGDLPGALAAARKAVALSPSHPGYRLQLGRMELLAGNADRAVTSLEPLVAEQPWNYSARFALGQALQRAGQDTRSRSVLAAADSIRERTRLLERLELNARDVPSSLNFARYAEALRGAGRLEEALSAYNRAIALDPGNVALQNNVATIYLQMGRTREAISRYQRIVALHPESMEAWLNLSVHAARQGHLEDARRFLAEAEAIQPEHPMVIRLRQMLAAGPAS